MSSRGTHLLALLVCAASTALAQAQYDLRGPSVLPSGAGSFQTGYVVQPDDAGSHVPPPRNPQPYQTQPYQTQPYQTSPPPQNAPHDGKLFVGGGKCSEPLCATCCPVFDVEVRGLIMSRNRPKFEQISFDDTNLLGQVLDTHTDLGRWYGGLEVRLGHVSPGGARWEAVYWGLFPDTSETTVLAASLPGNLNSVFDFSPLNIGATNVNDLFDGAQAHRLRRSYEAHNLEWNFVQAGYSCASRQPLEFTWQLGVRYLRFDDGLQYASADASPVFGAVPAGEGYYDIDVRNSLLGLQLGGRSSWRPRPRLHFHTVSQVGVYGNQMEHRSRIYNANGVAVVGPGNPLAGRPFDIASDEEGVSFLGELAVGLDVQPCRNWTLTLGYRVIALTGMAVATDQIPRNLADLPGVADIDANSDLILHGAYAGIRFCH